MRLVRLLVVLLTFMFIPFLAMAEGSDVFEVNLFIKDHIFTPSYVEAPSGRKIRLIINNQDDSAEEFESFDLHREKIVPAKTSAHVVLAPLEPGQYKFFGDFHQETAHGVLCIKKMDH